jgi:hypothetical protein
MVWGGAFNEKGSNYVRYLVQAEKVLKFLEKFKEVVSLEEKECIEKTIAIIVDYYTKSKTNAE